MNDHPTSSRRVRQRILTLAAGTLLAVAACGGPEEEAPLEDFDIEVDGGAVGPDVRVSEDVELQQVQLEYPLDGVYEEGEDARLFMAITNTGSRPVTLVDVSGPDFGGIAVESVDRTGLPLRWTATTTCTSAPRGLRT